MSGIPRIPTQTPNLGSVYRTTMPTFSPHSINLFSWSTKHKLRETLLTEEVFHIRSSLDSCSFDKHWDCLVYADALSYTGRTPDLLLSVRVLSSVLTCEETSRTSGGRQTPPVAPSRFPVVQGTLLGAGSVRHRISVGISCHWVWCNVHNTAPEEINQQMVSLPGEASQTKDANM